MSKRNTIGNLAQREGIEVSEFLQRLLDQYGHEQKKIADGLNISQSAVSQALEKAGFQRVQRYERKQSA